jgi:hypothetical protein
VLLGVFATGTSTHALWDIAADSDMARWSLFLGWFVCTAGTVLAFAVRRRLHWPLLVLVYVTVGVQSLFTKLVGEVGGTFVAAAAVLRRRRYWPAPNTARPAWSCSSPVSSPSPSAPSACAA